MSKTMNKPDNATVPLEIHVGAQLAGHLFKSDTERNKFTFGYQQPCPPQAAVSLLNSPHCVQCIPHPAGMNRAHW
jgi:hypothetical protein